MQCFTTILFATFSEDCTESQHTADATSRQDSQKLGKRNDKCSGQWILEENSDINDLGLISSVVPLSSIQKVPNSLNVAAMELTSEPEA